MLRVLKNLFYTLTEAWWHTLQGKYLIHQKLNHCLGTILFYLFSWAWIFITFSVETFRCDTFNIFKGCWQLPLREYTLWWNDLLFFNGRSIKHCIKWNIHIQASHERKWLQWFCCSNGARSWWSWETWSLDHHTTLWHASQFEDHYEYLEL